MWLCVQRIGAPPIEFGRSFAVRLKKKACPPRYAPVREPLLISPAIWGDGTWGSLSQEEAEGFGHQEGRGRRRPWHGSNSVLTLFCSYPVFFFWMSVFFCLYLAKKGLDHGGCWSIQPFGSADVSLKREVQLVFRPPFSVVTLLCSA